MNNAGLEQAFSLEVTENAYELRTVVGRIPDFINGSIYMNGPALFRRGKQAYLHWLDGDGMVIALRFRGGRAYFANRFVRTDKLCREEEQGRLVFRTFGTSFPGAEMVRGVAIASPVNVSVCPFGGKLLAFGEQGLPWELDPETLTTHGPFDFNGRLNDVSPFAGHPDIDAVSGDLLNFGVSYSASKPLLHFYRFTPETIRYRKRIPLPYPCSLHDFGSSREHAVFYLSPYLLDMAKLMKGGAVLDALTWSPELESRLLILSKETGEVRAEVPIGHGYCLHFINCFENERGLIVDVLELERPVYDQYLLTKLFRDVGPGEPTRFVIDVEAGRVLERLRLGYRAAPDFPIVDRAQAGQPYQHFWMLGISQAGTTGNKFFDELVHLSWTAEDERDIYRTPPGHYLVGEPVYISGRGRSSGIVVCPWFDAQNAETSFVLFEGDQVRRGPIARIQLEHPIPPLFHASPLVDDPFD